MEFIDGCEVSPDIELIAASTISTPACDAINTVATPLPDVSCVWRCTGIDISSFKAFTNLWAAYGFNKADISFMPNISAPDFSISFARFT